jgi:branched-chain amino acid transport system permease protein
MPAYTLALLCQDWRITANILPLFLLPLSGGVASLFALPLGWVALRVRGNTFVILTIAIFFSFQLLAYNLPGITHGSVGMDLPTPSWSGDIYNTPFYYAALALVVLALVVAWGVRRSKYGLGLLAIRDDEDRALGMGIKAGRYKLIAYVLSAWFVGVAGGIYAYFVGSVDPSFVFNPAFDVAITLTCFLGGLGTLSGPIVGAVIVVPLQQYLTLQFEEPGVSQIFYGIVFLTTLLASPEGVVPSIQTWWKRKLIYEERKENEKETR